MSYGTASLLGAPGSGVPTGSAGAVGGPSSATSNEVAVFDGTTGRLIKQADGAITLTASGSNQDVTITPSGSGVARIGRSSGATLASGSRVHIVGPDADSVFQYFDAYGGSAVGLYRRANGTLAAPTRVASGDTIGILGFSGYAGTAGVDGAYLTATRSSVVGVAAENWTASAQGASVALRSTPTGSTTQAARLTVEAGGDVSINTGNLMVSTANRTLHVKQGANGKAGTFTLSSGSATLNNTSITANSVLVCWLKTASGSVTMQPYATAVSVGTSFTIAGGAGDNSTYNYIIIEATP